MKTKFMVTRPGEHTGVELYGAGCPGMRGPERLAIGTMHQGQGHTIMLTYRQVMRLRNELNRFLHSDVCRPPRKK